MKEEGKCALEFGGFGFVLGLVLEGRFERATLDVAMELLLLGCVLGE